MELEVGMYVRFNYHRVTVPIQISKIKEKHYEDIERYYYYLTDNGLVISEAQILKASHNIIDIIEVGDYVNGYEVTSKDQFLGFGNHDWYMTNDEIKSIVTREQFEAMEYKVESEVK